MSNIFRKQGINTGGGGGSNTNFLGTRAEWEALTTSQQNAYDTVDIVGEDSEETSKYIGNDVDLKSYSANNRFTIPSDGYVSVMSLYSNTGQTGFIRVQRKNGTSFPFGVQSINGYVSMALFVQKGMEVFVESGYTNDITLVYSPIVL